MAICSLALQMQTWRPILPFLLDQFKETQNYVQLLLIFQYLPDCAAKNVSRV